MKFTGQLITGDFEENTMTFEIEGEIVLQAGKYNIEQIEVGNSGKNLGSGLFVLYKDDDGIYRMYWNGTDWVHDPKECPTYSWEKANEYAAVMGCRFTDAPNNR